ncbi:MAG: iron ABC transporter [Bacteroidetes bacterium GWF2_42_66]|nr:MAG: iron ABC transporter [Bacteroidetes bacterium GWA2_42_15]OFY03015.1 MAG: iron ABC transporter [Bacteroidetes bacterium GWE2_42_39]OFY43267.1 MAG: iron ABC transporter [Bacteroidetes bacterium GWF2_42_66]
MKLKNTSLFLLLFLVAVVFFVLDVFVGSLSIPFKQVFSVLLGISDASEEIKTIVLDFRLPKALTAVTAGIALSVSGLQMQTIFRNPLAGPDVLGISAGASLGVAILVLGFSSVLGVDMFSVGGSWALVIMAWLGSGMVMFLILAVSIRIKDILTILILGILFASAASAIVSIMQYFSNESMLKSFIIWTMGSLGSVTHSQLNVLIPSVLVGLVIAFFSAKSLDVMLLGEQYAKSMGLQVKTVRIMVFFSTSILAGSITAFCGPIGFIGIAVPHIARLLFKTASHRVLVPASVLLGAIVMLFSDIVAQMPGFESTLPINSVTALVGIPFVIWIIMKNRKFTSV